MKLFIIILLSFNVCLSNAQGKDDIYKKAIKYSDKKDYEKALLEIDKVLKIDSNNFEFLLFKGNIFEKMDKLEMAYEIYTEVIKAKPDNVNALSQRGLLLKRTHNFQSALNDFNKALEFANPDSIKFELYLNRGTIKSDLRDFDGAYADFIKAYQIDSINVAILNNLAFVCDEVGRGDKTLEFLKRAIMINPKFTGAYLNIGFKYQKMGYYQRAIDYFNKALLLNPNEPLGYSNRAYSKYKLGHTKDALRDVNKSIRLYSTNSYAYRIRAFIFIAMNERDKACADIDKSLSLGFTTMYGDEVKQLKEMNCQ